MVAFVKISMLVSKAEKGDLGAQLELAETYRTGRGVMSSFTKALKFYSMAARQNDPQALFFIAECQDLGRGMTQDALLAFNNYRKAADQGHLEAMVTVGHFYELGRAVERDVAQAKKFYERAARAGHPDAARKLASLEKELNSESITVPLDELKARKEREAEEKQNIHSIRRLVLDSLSNCNDKQKLQKVLSTLRGVG
jgi:TPR repeat protein